MSLLQRTIADRRSAMTSLIVPVYGPTSSGEAMSDVSDLCRDSEKCVPIGLPQSLLIESFVEALASGTGVNGEFILDVSAEMLCALGVDSGEPGMPAVVGVWGIVGTLGSDVGKSRSSSIPI